MPEVVFEQVFDGQVGDGRIGMADEETVVPGIAPKHWINNFDIAVVAQGIAVIPLEEVVGNVVLDALGHFHDPQTAPASVIDIQSQHAIVGVVALVRGDKLVAQMPHSEAQLRREVSTDIDVEAAMIALVGEVGAVVVFKAIDPSVVVGVNAVEELRSFDVLPQEGLFVVGDQVDHPTVVVLVVIGDEVVVLVPAGEDCWVGDQCVVAAPIGDPVLVVIVLDKVD